MTIYCSYGTPFGPVIELAEWRLINNSFRMRWVASRIWVTLLHWCLQTSSVSSDVPGCRLAITEGACGTRNSSMDKHIAEFRDERLHVADEYTRLKQQHGQVGDARGCIQWPPHDNMLLYRELLNRYPCVCRPACIYSRCRLVISIAAPLHAVCGCIGHPERERVREWSKVLLMGPWSEINGMYYSTCESTIARGFRVLMACRRNALIYFNNLIVFFTRVIVTTERRNGKESCIWGS